MTTNGLAQLHDYRYENDNPSCSNAYLSGLLRTILLREATPPRKIFEIGCGNGATADMLTGIGYSVTGIDASASGIKIARETYPRIRFDQGSVYDDLASRYGTFPVVISLEVIEHLYSPREFVECLYRLLETGGLGIISTPYHGYIKNLFLALTGRFDSHFNPLWDDGHIKFWSQSTLAQLLREARFERLSFFRAGRTPPLAKSMIAVFRKP